VDLGEQRSRGDRHDAAVGKLPTELLDDLEGDRLRALRVVRAHVDVHERPVVVLGRQLGAQAIDLVVVTANGHQVRAVDAGAEDLLLFEVGGDEDVGRQPERGGLGGDGVAEVAGRGAGERAEAQLAGPRRSDRDDAILEGVRRVGGVVLDPHLTQTESLGQTIRADQRRPARGEPGPRGQVVGRPRWTAHQRQEVRVAPDILRSSLDAPTQRRHVVGGAVVVVDL
jgi:hypothetical protein